MPFPVPDALMKRLTEVVIERYLAEQVQRILIDKAARRTDHQNYLSARRRAEYMQREILQPAVNSWFKQIRKPLQQGAAEAARARTAAAGANKIANWDEIERIGNEAMRIPFLRALAYSIGAATEGLRKQADPAGDKAIEYTQEHTADLVTSVTRATKDAIKLYIQEMVRYGMTAQKIAQNLRPVVGLLPRHSTAVGRYMTKLLDQGVAYDDAAKKAQRYANKLHRYRTRMIARTESSFAQGEGTLQAYEAMGITHVKWIADPEACPICRARNGKVYPIEQAHGMQPAHPHCECAWVAAREPKEKPPKRQKFSGDAMSDDEHYALGAWAGAGYKDIKGYMTGTPAMRRAIEQRYGMAPKKDAEILKKMFDKYIDGAQNQEIYRGLSHLTDDVFEDIQTNWRPGQIVKVDNALSSWSKDFDVADNFSRGPKQVLMRLKKGRKLTHELDITNFAREAEQEVLLRTKNFKVVKVKKVKLPGYDEKHPYWRMDVTLEEAGAD